MQYLYASIALVIGCMIFGSSPVLAWRRQRRIDRIADLDERIGKLEEEIDSILDAAETPMGTEILKNLEEEEARLVRCRNREQLKLARLLDFAAR